jgi:hypothetical protein
LYCFLISHKQHYKGESSLKIIRCYASSENAVNVKNLIEDLLVAELEKIINSQKIDKNLLNEDKFLRGECA